MKYCPECGHPIEGNSEYCVECGRKIPDDLKVDWNGSAFHSFDEKKEKEYSLEGRKILIDYFEQETATTEKAAYFEIVLYTHSKEDVLMEVYTQGGTDQERCMQKLVPYKAYEDALKVTKDFHLKQLLGRRGVPIEGKKYVIRFREREEDEEIYRFDIENVGEEDTMMMFPEMLNTLMKYR